MQGVNVQKVVQLLLIIFNSSDGMSKTARELYSYDNLVDFPSATIDDLEKYYLFYGRYCDKEWLEELKTEYKGKIYDYNEYRDMIKKGLHI